MTRPVRRKRSRKHLAEKGQRKIQKAMTTALLDTVLSNLSYQDISNLSGHDGLLSAEVAKGIGNSVSESKAQSTRIDTLPLQHLHASIFPIDLAKRIQHILDQYREKCPLTASEGKQLAAMLNQVINGAKLTLYFQPTREPVRLRVITPATSSKAYFQLRTANAKQQAVYTGINFPPLSVF